MEAKELRIGNYINQGEQLGELPLNAYQIYQFSLGGFISSNNIPTYYHYWKPVPLTEEWLVKFGFKKELSSSKDYFNFILNDDYRVYENDGSWNISLVFLGGYDGDTTEPSSHYFIKELLYVHQLQNLYFALTGNELNIK